MLITVKQLNHLTCRLPTPLVHKVELYFLQ